MNSPESEIESCIIANNYAMGLKIAKEWLINSSGSGEDDSEYIKAKEAYICTKFFFDRHDRIHSIEIGRERAKIFIAYLQALKEIRKKHNLNSMNRIWKCVYQITHSEIAKNLAKDMAGQKSYNLQEDDIFQLTFSLIELQDFKAAHDTLIFLYNIKARSSLVNLLLAYVSYENQNIQKMEIYLREALFINPDILKDYSEFIPSDTLKKLWEEVAVMGYCLEKQCRNFALLAEINPIYVEKREVSYSELKRIEADYERLSSEYTQNPGLKDLIQPRLLHYLTWLIFYFMKYSNHDKAGYYQKLMIEWEPEAYSIFKKNHL